jgi:hypothetical protein
VILRFEALSRFARSQPNVVEFCQRQGIGLDVDLELSTRLVSHTHNISSLVVVAPKKQMENKIKTPSKNAFIPWKSAPLSLEHRDVVADPVLLVLRNAL